MFNMFEKLLKIGNFTKKLVNFFILFIFIFLNEKFRQNARFISKHALTPLHLAEKRITIEDENVVLHFIWIPRENIWISSSQSENKNDLVIKSPDLVASQGFWWSTQIPQGSMYITTRKEGSNTQTLLTVMLLVISNCEFAFWSACTVGENPPKKYCASKSQIL